MELETWYKAEDQHERDGEYFYNYFIDLGNGLFGYYSITFKHKNYPYDFYYTEDEYETIKDNILDNYEFEEISERQIIEDCFK